MKRPTLRIVEYRHSASSKYVIEGVRVNGKRKPLFFPALNFRFSENGNAVIYDDGNGVCLLVARAGKLSLNWLMTPT